MSSCYQGEVSTLAACVTMRFPLYFGVKLKSVSSGATPLALNYWSLSAMVIYSEEKWHLKPAIPPESVASAEHISDWLTLYPS